MFFSKKPGAYLAIALFLSALPSLTIAGDLDDGISKYTDDSVGKYDELGKPDKNVKYIIRKSKAKAAIAMKDGNASASGSGSGEANMNSVVMGAGSNIKGDIIIIDQSKGDKTQIAE